MRRFTVEVILISLAATVIWWATGGLLRPTTVAAAKGLHALVGYPAPYLLADLDGFYWFAPLFPPLVGLVFASRWVPWRRRLIGLLIGLAAFWYLVALQVVVVYTPYFTLSAVRAYLSAIQVSLNTAVVPVVLWLIVTGGPPRGWTPELKALRPGDAGRKSTNHRNPEKAKGYAGTVFVTLAFCALATLPLFLAAQASTPNLDDARDRLARARLARDHAAALTAVDAMFQEQGRNAALSYLQSELYRELGDEAAANRIASETLSSERRRAATRRRSKRN